MTDEEFQHWQNTFYHSPAWIKLRDYVKTKFFGICQMCGKQYKHKDLIVHHKEPITKENCERAEITLSEENLIPLCWTCHNRIHYANGNQIYQFDADGNIIKTMRLGANDLDFLP